jgi:hypothetical protein
MTVATALAVSWNPFENSKASTRMKQKVRTANAIGEDGAMEANMQPKRAAGDVVAAS